MEIKVTYFKLATKLELIALPIFPFVVIQSIVAWEIVLFQIYMQMCVRYAGMYLTEPNSEAEPNYSTISQANY